MRCRIGEKKLAKYSRKFGIEFIKGLTRGNTNHRIDLWDKEGKEYTLWPNGILELYNKPTYEFIETENGFIARIT